MNCVDISQPSRVFIVDDHPLVRSALRQVLSREPTLSVVGEAVSGEDALAQLDGRPPNLFLVDFSLPGMDGTQLIRELVQKYPDVYCVVVSSHHELLYAKLSLSAGAHGYVTKGDPDVLLDAINRVLKGEIVIETSA